MNKSTYIKEITKDINFFDTKKLKELSIYIKFLKYHDFIDPTLEIISNEEWYEKVKTGLAEKAKGEVVNWNSVQ
jgi:hypothetical protein